jgi:hypothetical protein
MRFQFGASALALLFATGCTQIPISFEYLERSPEYARLASFDPTPPGDFSEPVSESPVEEAARPVSPPTAEPQMEPELPVAAPLIESEPSAERPAERIALRQERIEVAESMLPPTAAPSSDSILNDPPANKAPAPAMESIPRPEVSAKKDSATTTHPDANNRLARQMGEIQVNIRPASGVMPETNLASLPMRPDVFRYAEEMPREEIYLGWTPWTVCHRPLYFEDCSLERYGENYGAFQPAVSMFKFYTHATLLPVSMMFNRPRSYQCGDGIPDGTVNCCP